MGLSCATSPSVENNRQHSIGIFYHYHIKNAMKHQPHRTLYWRIKLLLLYHRILNTEPLIKRFIDLFIYFRRNLILNLLVDIEHCHAIV